MSYRNRRVVSLVDDSHMGGPKAGTEGVIVSDCTEVPLIKWEGYTNPHRQDDCWALITESPKEFEFIDTP